MYVHKISICLPVWMKHNKGILLVTLLKDMSNNEHLTTMHIASTCEYQWLIKDRSWDVNENWFHLKHTCKLHTYTHLYSSMDTIKLL